MCPHVPLFRGHGTEAMCTQAVLRGEVTGQWKVGQRTLWPQPQESAVFSGFLCDLLFMSLAIHSFTHFEYLKTGHNDTYSLEQCPHIIGAYTHLICFSAEKEPGPVAIWNCLRQVLLHPGYIPLAKMHI